MDAVIYNLDLIMSLLRVLVVLAAVLVIGGAISVALVLRRR